MLAAHDSRTNHPWGDTGSQHLSRIRPYSDNRRSGIFGITGFVGASAPPLQRVSRQASGPCYTFTRISHLLTREDLTEAESGNRHRHGLRVAAGSKSSKRLRFRNEINELASYKRIMRESDAIAMMRVMCRLRKKQILKRRICF